MACCSADDPDEVAKRGPDPSDPDPEAGSPELPADPFCVDSCG